MKRDNAIPSSASSSQHSVATRRLAIFLPDLGGGGAERVSVNLANAFSARGYAVDLLLLRKQGELLGSVSDAVRVVSLDRQRFRQAMRPLSQYLASERPDAILACMWPLTLLAIWARLLTRSTARLVVAEHTTWSQCDLPPSRRWLARASMRMFFRSADAVVAVSHGAADDLADFAHLGRNRVSVIYNPVVDDSLQERDIQRPTEPVEWCHGGHRRLLAVGSLKKVKDYDTLLRAFARLVIDHDAKLLILGEGSQREGLQALAESLRISDRLFMPGYVADPTPYYRHAHLHVLSSRIEGLPTVLIEALAAGTPIVSTDCRSGPREILDNGRFGRLVPVGDPDALAQAMAGALDDPVDRVALKERAGEFSIARAVDQYESLLLFPGPASSAADTRPEVRLRPPHAPRHE